MMTFDRLDLSMMSLPNYATEHLLQILRLSEDILDQVVQEDGEIQASTVMAVYLQKTPVFLSLYKKYCLGLKRADCVLVSRFHEKRFLRILKLLKIHILNQKRNPTINPFLTR